MKLVTLASGSKGNCTYLETREAKILIDAGLTLKQIEVRLGQIEVDPSEVDAILLTHEHSDHIKGAGRFAKKHGAKIYAHNFLWQVLGKKLGEGLTDYVDFFSDDFFIKDLTVSSFEVPHDSAYCVGYNFYFEGKKISIATDLGHTNPRIIERLKNSTIVILEANYDEKLLRQNPKYPVFLKNRISSSRGHLSNEKAGEVIAQLAGSNVKQVILAHLSEENNAPEMAFNTVKKFLLERGIEEGKHIFVDVAHQHKIGNIFKLK
jgi:phosphoribosyl 1,2-cyclic phosphodiesterase